MKKSILVFILFFIPFYVFANDKYVVTLNKCVDGDTASFKLNNKVIKARFLAIDTPESVHPTKEVELYGKEASKYTCDKLSNAKKIEIEYDPNSEKMDKYGRHLMWVYVDESLIQNELVSIGYAKVAYLYGDYLYTDQLKSSEKSAQKKNIGIWKNSKSKEEKLDILDIIIDMIYEILKKMLDFVEKIIDSVI